MTMRARSPIDDPEVLDKLDAILVEIRGLREDLARDRRRPSRANVLATIAIAVGDRAFNAAEVLDHAEVDRDLAEALDAAHLTTPRALGRYLRTIAGRTIHGIRVVQIGADRDGIVWRASFSPEDLKPAYPVVPRIPR